MDAQPRAPRRVRHVRRRTPRGLRLDSGRARSRARDGDGDATRGRTRRAGVVAVGPTAAPVGGTARAPGDRRGFDSARWRRRRPQVFRSRAATTRVERERRARGRDLRICEGPPRVRAQRDAPHVRLAQPRRGVSESRFHRGDVLPGDRAIGAHQATGVARPFVEPGGDARGRGRSRFVGGSRRRARGDAGGGDRDRKGGRRAGGRNGRGICRPGVGRDPGGDCERGGIRRRRLSVRRGG